MNSDRDRKIYETLVHNHAVGLYRFAYRLSGSVETAEDLVQETYYEAWRSIKNLRDPNRVRAWIFQILRHRYAHWVRDNKRRPQITAGSESLEDQSLSASHEPLNNPIEQKDQLQKALNALEDRYKEPFLMVFMEGLTCQETAECLDLPLGTVLSRIHRARLFLRSFLSLTDQQQDDRSADEQGANTNRVLRPRFRLEEKS